MKKLIAVFLILVLSLTLLACAPDEIMLNCDGCGKSVPCSEGMDNSWVIYCEECQDNLLDD